MKKVLMLTLCLTMCAGAAMADHIGLYADQAGTECFDNTLSFPPTINPVYIVHKFNAGSTASQFKVNDTSGMFQAGQTTSYLLIGGWYTGATVAYGGCLGGDIVVATLNYLWFGQPVICGRMEIVPDPTAAGGPVLATVDCGFNLKPATGGTFYFSSVPGTVCGSCNEPNAVENATWGTIKALYR